MSIETEIRHMIEEIIGWKYIGKLRVIEEALDNGNTLWSLLIYLNLELTPMILSYEGSKEDFMAFIKKEIKHRKLHNVDFWKVVQKSPNEEECDDYE